MAKKKKGYGWSKRKGSRKKSTEVVMMSPGVPFPPRPRTPPLVYERNEAGLPPVTIPRTVRRIATRTMPGVQAPPSPRIRPRRRRRPRVTVVRSFEEAAMCQRTADNIRRANESKKNLAHATERGLNDCVGPGRVFLKEGKNLKRPGGELGARNLLYPARRITTTGSNVIKHLRTQKQARADSLAKGKPFKRRYRTKYYIG